ncbi:hypothetical protein jhhlp_006167 [Lomentospora prolificans]|uniref:F-box domain-containing protein n=1 Tax=Lomentospora prolificans TaxID=41688 RepID=A0A2N3N548_9PEZI|nr:hypothetical protein jhhlp_006167 [Lomentospora prolificans]
MASGPQLFYSLWQAEGVREKLFHLLPKSDLANVRLASSACCNLVTKRLFLRTHITFTANTFTKQSRIQALSRIGHHIEHLTFNLPHSEATFLPPLIHPETGQEINFLYTPHTSMASVLTRPKYANAELGDILTLQYPPLFHAATNVPSFINALMHIPNMRHLTIKCPGQDPRERYRRDIVDYALISLRIAVERTPMTKLSKLSLVNLHPAAFNYIRHIPGFGVVPSASRRWGQIRKLYITVESWDFYSPNPGLDQLKVIDDYIRSFSQSLEKFTFTWNGRFKGPCPLYLAADPLFRPPQHSQKLFNEVTSPMSPLPSPPSRKVIHFPKLRYMQVRNATMTTTQLSEIVGVHRGTVKEFDFESVVLLNGGSWEEALAPLMEPPADGPEVAEVWSRSSSLSESGSFETSASATSSACDDDLQSPSAAVAAAGRELLSSELGFDFDDEEYDDLASDIAAAREASKTFSTKLTKKRVHRRRRRKHKSDDEREQSSEKHRSRGRSRHRNGHRHENSSGSSKDKENNSTVSGSSSSRTSNSNNNNSSSGKSKGHRRHKSDEEPVLVPRAPNRTPSPPIPLPAVITAPIPNMDPQPVLLQPTVYNPNAPASRDPDDCITPVQRNIEKEEAHRLLAEDEGIRMSALRRAKEAVLAKLSWEYNKRMGGGNPSGISATPAVVAATHTVSRDMFAAANCGASAAANMARFKDNFFGKSTISVLSDHRALDSQTALVPLMFSHT